MDGRYIYCIVEWKESQPAANFGNVGIDENAVYTVGYKDGAAVVSSIPFKQMESNLDDIVAHQRVVEAARETRTVLPVRFGVMLKNDVGEIVLNAVYPVDRSKIHAFDAKVKELKERFESEGVTIHRSGPWAPYSFC